MRHALFLSAVLAWTTLVPSLALAQGTGGGGLLDRIGQTLFGSPKTSEQAGEDAWPATDPTPRAGTGSSATVDRGAEPTPSLRARTVTTDGSREPSRWAIASDSASTTSNSPALVSTGEPTAQTSNHLVPTAAESAEPAAPGAIPLHKRLTGFRESVFQSGSATGSNTVPADEKAAATPKSPVGRGKPASAAAVRSPGVSYGEPHLAPPLGKRAPTFSARPSELSAEAQAPTLAPPPAWATASPPVGSRVVPNQIGDSDSTRRPQLDEALPGSQAAIPAGGSAAASASEPKARAGNDDGGSDTADTLHRALHPQTGSSGIAVESAESGESSGASDRQAAGGVLFARQSPILSVETVGPRRIAVGKPSSYEISIQNSGPVVANQVVVTVDLPDWADVLGTQASAGAATMAAADSGSPRQLGWKVGRLDSKGREKLILRIVPRQSRPFDLAVKWDYTPVGSQAMIEVQEAKLAMQLQGPREVVFGKPEVFRLEVSNPGNGAAENVSLVMAPMGPSASPPATHQFGTLAAGEKKAIEVELTARHTGTLTIKVDAKAEGGIEAHLAENILIRRPNLQVSVEAPAVQFVGTQITYRIHLSNPGNAAAERVQVSATLPPEAKYVSSAEGGKLGPDHRKVTWTMDRLEPAGETALLLSANLESPGTSRLDVSATADGQLMASGDASTRVEAMAALALSVVDPSGPVRIGDEAVYEIQVQNRGTKEAENVEIIAYFSSGVEPVSAEGAHSRIGQGQVVFDPIPVVAAGQSVVVKVRARAATAGNLVFRAEVHCKPLGTRLVSEETTFFYNAAGTPTAGDSSKQPSKGPATSEPNQRTAAQGASGDASPEARKKPSAPLYYK